MANELTLLDVALAELARAVDQGVTAHLSMGMAAVLLRHLGVDVPSDLMPSGGALDDLDKLRRRVER